MARRTIEENIEIRENKRDSYENEINMILKKNANLNKQDVVSLESFYDLMRNNETSLGESYKMIGYGKERSIDELIAVKKNMRGKMEYKINELSNPSLIKKLNSILDNIKLSLSVLY